jgi:hypothetical protein
MRDEVCVCVCSREHLDALSIDYYTTAILRGAVYSPEHAVNIERKQCNIQVYLCASTSKFSARD